MVGVGGSIQISIISIPRGVLVSDRYWHDEINIFVVCVSAASLLVLMSSAPLHLSQSAHSGSLCHSSLPPPALPARAEMEWRPLMMAERKRSAVWSYFTVSDRETTTCDVCRKAIPLCGNTTNLYMHLKAAHPKVNAELQSKWREEKEEEEEEEEEGAPQTRTRSLAQRQTSLSEAFEQNLNNIQEAISRSESYFQH